MRTRRSWRNQNRLWEALTPEIAPVKPLTVIRTNAEIDAMFWVSKTSRMLMKRDAAKARKESK